MMEKLKKIAELFPNVTAEIEGKDGKHRKGVDFDLLKQTPSDVLVEDEYDVITNYQELMDKVLL